MLSFSSGMVLPPSEKEKSGSGMKNGVDFDHLDPYPAIRWWLNPPVIRSCRKIKSVSGGGWRRSGPCLSPSVADHLLGPATDHRLVLFDTVIPLLPFHLEPYTSSLPNLAAALTSSTSDSSFNFIRLYQ
ncbi:hypothetical protein L1987_10909 [Smallanthus sonchifolius]|uniref:Uncharacterized protein n=1 Tax=Smallanthus sonchifolius TaxID=185202 RepID=A0ACB9JBI8_9ASTR|nr:hypothetical protein L1987_10909 [Smallanthus sonchifolius]